MKTLILPIVIIGLIVGVLLYKSPAANNPISLIPISISPTPMPDPMNIKYMRQQNYPGSDITITQTLAEGSNYKRYIVSFVSDGLKEFAYMTVPKTVKPQGGFPVIIFNHGYQIPELYTPDGNYIAYMDAIAKAGYIIFKPDYRGNGKSEGAPGSAYFSSNYAIDDLNAIASVKKYPDANPSKIGMWGHSMGGNITLRAAEISPDIKVVVIWGGVVGNYSDIIYNWQNRVSYQPAREDLYLRNLNLQEMLAKNGSPQENPSFWNSIDPTENLNFINMPFQIHVGLGDNEVPPDFSRSLYQKLNNVKKNIEYYEYPGANHDINQGFSLAMKRTIDFFDRYLK